MSDILEKQNAKDFFEESKSITQEKIDAQRGLATESQVLTAAYLKRLRKAADYRPTGTGRYRG